MKKIFFEKSQLFWDVTKKNIMGKIATQNVLAPHRILPRNTQKARINLYV